MINFRLFSFIFSIFTTTLIYSEWYNEIKHFNLPKDPIDVVIACHEKDKYTLDYCISNAKKHIKNVRKIIILSEKKLSDKAEWFDEALFPFSKKSISDEFALSDPTFYENPNKIKRVGWYFKQIMNFYAAFVIPDISNNILILDADVMFCKPVEFIDNDGNMLHAPGTEDIQFYFEHMGRLLPGLKKVIPNYSGISHHMLFQKPILKDLFELVESHHKVPFWKAYCRSVEPIRIESSGSADYEIYFNFVLMRTKQIKIRPLVWENISSISFLPFVENNYDFVSCHSYARSEYEMYIENLILSGDNLNIKDDEDNTLIMVAIKKNNPLLVKKIISALKKEERINFLNSKNKQGLSALHLSNRWHDLTTFIELLKNGASLYVVDSNGNTPLSDSIIYDNQKILPTLKEFLINERRKFKELINMKNYEGSTPLHLAVRHRNISAAKLLISYGANKKIVNNENLTPYQYAETFDLKDKNIVNIIKILK